VKTEAGGERWGVRVGGDWKRGGGSNRLKGKGRRGVRRVGVREAEVKGGESMRREGKQWELEGDDKEGGGGGGRGEGELKQKRETGGRLGGGGEGGRRGRR